MRLSQPLKVFLGTWAALVALTSLWIVATPIAASPDEPAHMIKAAAVVRGEWIGPPSPEGTVVHVPQYVAWTLAETCYAFNGDATPACSDPIPKPVDAIVESHTTAGLYNPVYYVMVGWPTLFAHDDWGIFAMRFLSAIITMSFLAAAFALVSTWSRRVIPLVGLVVVATPMLLFLGASVNPNALEATTALSVFVGMLSLTLVPDPPNRVASVAVISIAGAIGMNARALSPLWLAVAVLVPLILVERGRLLPLLRRRSTLVAAAAVLAGTIFAVAWTVGSNSLGGALTDPDLELDNPYPGTGQPAIYGFVYMLERTVSFSRQIIGLFGWMDTDAPDVVAFVWAVLIGVTLVAAAVLLRRRALLVFAILAAAYVLLPAVIQAAFVTGGGYIWQGRYAFALFGMLIVGAAALLADRLPVPSRTTASRLLVLLGTAVSLGHVYAYAFVLKRYVAGITGTWVDLALRPIWSPPVSAVLLIVTFAVAVVVAVLTGARVLLPTVPSPATAELSERVETGHSTQASTDGR